MKHVNKILVLMLVVLSWTVEAQIQELTRLSEIVIDGEVIATESKWNDERNLIFTENRILVKTVFKGQIQDSVITILTTGGVIDDHLHYKTHEINMTKGESGYFFLTPNYSSNSNYFSDERYGFVQSHGNLNKFTSVFGEKRSITEFENLIIEETKFPKLNFEKHQEIFSIQAFGERDTCDLLPLTRNVKSIEFTFDSVRYTPDLEYLEFDIMANVNTPGLKFGKGDLFIRYDKTFGENVVTKGSVEITKGEIIQNSLYDLHYDDYDANSIYVSADSEFGSNQMYTFTSTAAELLHVKVKIDDFTQIGSISFDSIDISGSVYYWCQGNYNLFDKVNLDAPIISVESSTPIGIIYTFENAQPINNNTQFKVDIMAEATNTSQYSGGNVEVTYNTSAFGSNVISSGNATFERGPLIADASVYTSHFVQDVAMIDNIIQIFTFSDPAITSGRTTLGTSKIRLGTLTFDIEDCEADKGIAFDQFGTIDLGNHIHYTGSMPVPNENYDPVIADDTETGKVCGCSKPVITSFSGPDSNNPHTIHGGIDEVLTIQGSNFGNFEPMTSTVIFKNGDDTGPSEIEIGITDFRINDVIQWTDTEIKLTLPGCNKDKGIKNPPSTGKFKVRNQCDISDDSPDDIDIPYSIYTFRGAPHAKARRLNLQSTNDNNSICFNFSNDLPVWIQDQFELALASWCNKTGINFTIGSRIDENTPLGANDNINLVSFENGSGGGHIADAIFYQNNSCSNEGLFFSEIDFVLRSTLTNPQPADEERMQEVIKHELGHAHMLQHAKGFGQLMHPNGNTGPGGTITVNDSNGANLVFNASSSCASNPIMSGMCAVSCGGTNSTINTSSKEIKLYPNPVKETLILDYQNLKLEEVEIFDQQGRLWLSLKNPTEKIDVNSLPVGFYVLKVRTYSMYYNGKFIKI